MELLENIAEQTLENVRISYQKNGLSNNYYNQLLDGTLHFLYNYVIVLYIRQ